MICAPPRSSARRSVRPALPATTTWLESSTRTISIWRTPATVAREVIAPRSTRITSFAVAINATSPRPRTARTSATFVLHRVNGVLFPPSAVSPTARNTSPLLETAHSDPSSATLSARALGSLIVPTTARVAGLITSMPVAVATQIRGAPTAPSGRDAIARIGAP